MKPGRMTLPEASMTSVWGRRHLVAVGELWGERGDIDAGGAGLMHGASKQARQRQASALASDGRRGGLISAKLAAWAGAGCNGGSAQEGECDKAGGVGSGCAGICRTVGAGMRRITKVLGRMPD
jgi:hypothetical protein